MYDEPQHSIVHKWLLMTDPQDPASEAKVLHPCSVMPLNPCTYVSVLTHPYNLLSQGYLKISVNILGPGDVAVVSWLCTVE